MNVKILSFTSQKELNWPMFLQIVLNQISVKTWDIQVEKIKGRRQNDQRTAPKRSKDAAKKIKGRRKKDQRMPPKRSKDAAEKIKGRRQNDQRTRGNPRNPIIEWLKTSVLKSPGKRRSLSDAGRISLQQASNPTPQSSTPQSSTLSQVRQPPRNPFR